MYLVSKHAVVLEEVEPAVADETPIPTGFPRSIKVFLYVHAVRDLAGCGYVILTELLLAQPEGVSDPGLGSNAWERHPAMWMRDRHARHARHAG